MGARYSRISNRNIEGHTAHRCRRRHLPRPRAASDIQEWRIPGYPGHQERQRLRLGSPQRQIRRRDTNLAGSLLPLTQKTAGPADSHVQGNGPSTAIPATRRNQSHAGNKNKIYNGHPNPNVEHGGHGWNATNPKRNKDLFPESWTEDDIARAAIAIAKNPKPYPRQPQRDSGNYIVNGYAPGPGGGLNINVVVAPNGEIVTAYPDGGQPGVGRTGPDGRRR
ncbi:EndoU domain-containing protein [Nocardia sp. XZ_19_369]|uniref:EndoU domain-containing protein n=1 Tax=Nocardia sp. XZ_19_369 TaxID=2769487 RepID=UPI0035A36B44